MFRNTRTPSRPRDLASPGLSRKNGTRTRLKKIVALRALKSILDKVGLFLAAWLTEAHVWRVRYPDGTLSLPANRSMTVYLIAYHGGKRFIDYGLDL